MDNNIHSDTTGTNDKPHTILLFENYDNANFNIANYDLNYENAVINFICDTYSAIPIQTNHHNMEMIKNDNSISNGKVIIKINKYFELYDKKTIVTPGYFYGTYTTVSVVQLGKFKEITNMKIKGIKFDEPNTKLLYENHNTGAISLSYYNLNFTDSIKQYLGYNPTSDTTVDKMKVDKSFSDCTFIVSLNDNCYDFYRKKTTVICGYLYFFGSHNEVSITKLGRFMRILEKPTQMLH